jgi:Conserved mid region of cactin
MYQMPAESNRRDDHETRGIKRCSHSPPPWRRSHKASRASYEDGKGSNRRERYDTPERAQKEQVRLNQIQEDEKSREWVAQEDDFVLKQAKRRAEIRVKEGRAKPIDWLAVAMRTVDTTRNPLDDEFDPAEVDVINPSSVLEEMSEQQLSELEKDINTFLHLEKNAQNKDYWRVSWPDQQH